MNRQPDRLDPTGKPNLVTIVGGLGNQLFQYAFGQYLEARTGRTTRYDLSLLAGYKLHGGSLAIEQALDVSVQAATAKDLEHRPWLAQGPNRLKVAARLARWHVPAIPVRTDYDVEPSDLDNELPPRVYHGYWQRPCYAADAAARLTFRPDVLAAADAIIAAHDLDPVRDVAVHVRRGDYLTLPRACHLPLSESDYYAPLMRELRDVPGRRFVVASDDIEALREGPLEPFFPVFVDGRMSSSVAIDFCLLSRFRTIIMSASSFSWWAAALSPHRDGVILYPSPWVKLAFADDPAVTARPLPGWTLADTRSLQVQKAGAPDGRRAMLAR